MIRFGVVLTLVVAALGLLAGGMVTSSLLLVYLAIGVAALAALMLTIGAVMWRGEIFGPAESAWPLDLAAIRPGPAAQSGAVAQRTPAAGPGRGAGGGDAEVLVGTDSGLATQAAAPSAPSTGERSGAATASAAAQSAVVSAPGGTDQSEPAERSGQVPSPAEPRPAEDATAVWPGPPAAEPESSQPGPAEPRPAEDATAVWPGPPAAEPESSPARAR